TKLQMECSQGDDFKYVIIDFYHVDKNGKTSTYGSFKFLDSDFSGALPLGQSAAPDIDGSATFVSPGTHIYAADVLVDAKPGGVSSGNGSSSDGSIDGGGRYVAFATNATDLDPTIS